MTQTKTSIETNTPPTTEWTPPSLTQRLLAATPRTLRDVTAGFGRWRLWIFLSRHDLVIRYKRTWLGVSWVLISFALFVIAKVAVFGTLAGKELGSFAVYLSVGYMVFKFISAIIVDGANCLTSSETWIKGEALPYSIYAYRSVTRNLIVATMTTPPVVFVCAWYGAFNLESALSIPAVLVAYIANAIWISLLLGVICARLRDVSHLIIMGMSLTYFLTPVLWVKPDTGILATIATYNPFTYFIDIIRVPLMGGGIPWNSWSIVGIVTVSGVIVTTIVFGLLRNRVIYWL